MISKAISDLERTLKVRLVDRTAQGVEPTVYGTALLSGGTVVFDDLRHSVKQIEFLADPTAGEVRIAGFDTMTGGFIPAVIDRLIRKLPRASFRVFQALDPEGLHKMVRERSVDLIVLHLIAGEIEDEDLNVEILFPDSLAIVAGAKSKWARRRKVELAELVDEAWCLPMEGTLSALGIARAFRDKGLDPPRNVVNSNSLVLFQAMAATGRILTVASRTRLRLSGKSSILKAVPVDLNIPWGSVSIVTLKHRTINPAAQLFIECAREVARLLATSK